MEAGVADRRPHPCQPTHPLQEANPGRGLPALSPQEAAMMRSGAAELSRLRRAGAKAVKHPPLEKEVRGGVVWFLWVCVASVGVRVGGNWQPPTA